jgi:lysozyme family protein
VAIALVNVATAVAAAIAHQSVPQPEWWICWEGENVKLTDEMRREYEELFAGCAVKPEQKAEAERIVTRIMKNRGRYELVENETGVPWFIIAVVHNMECGGRFDCHLHNGDPLTARTVNVPKGRPAAGKPPFGWEASAIDALNFDGFATWTNWTVSGSLFKIEAYNGFGTRNHGVHTPYLWGGSFVDLNRNSLRDAGERPIFAGGKYVKDGVWDSKAQTKQIGAAVLLRRMVDQALIELPATAAK